MILCYLEAWQTQGVFQWLHPCLALQLFHFIPFTCKFSYVLLFFTCHYQLRLSKKQLLFYKNDFPLACPILEHFVDTTRTSADPLCPYCEAHASHHMLEDSFGVFSYLTFFYKKTNVNRTLDDFFPSKESQKPNWPVLAFLLFKIRKKDCFFFSSVYNIFPRYKISQFLLT
jgi:hypothetical protein